MIIRNLKLMRLKKGLTVKELMRRTGVYDTKILHFENLIINSIKPKELKKLTEEFKCSKEDIFKPVKVEKIGTSNRNVMYKVISYDVSDKELKKEIEGKYKKSLQYKGFGKNIDDKTGKINIQINMQTNNTSFECQNQACRLNSSWTGGRNGKTCMCDNPVVIRGDAPCYGRDKVQSKPKREGFDYHNTKNCFMKYTASKEERKKYYAL